MANDHQVKSWFAKHLSPILVFGLFVIGFVFLFTGTWVEGKYNEFLGKVLTELSMALFVGGIATVFLALPDIRGHLAEVLGALFTQGQIAKMLSVDAREVLTKEILRQRLGKGITTIDEDLLSGVTDLTDGCLKGIHLRNYNLITNFTPHPKNPAFLWQHTAITFRIKINHLSRPVEFLYKYFNEIDVPLGIKMSDDDFLLDFRVKVGSSEFTERKITREKNKGVCALRFEFEREFKLEVEGTGVELSYTAARLKSDNTSIWRARYPTREFQTSITHTEAFDYFCKWFASVGEKVGEPTRGGTSTLLGSAITATRDNWILPGEGVAIYWTPKQETAPAVPARDL